MWRSPDRNIAEQHHAADPNAELFAPNMAPGAGHPLGTTSLGQDVFSQVVWGARDSHIPEDGRARIESELQRAGTKFAVKLYDAEHAFMRDEGARYDPEATDAAWGEMVGLFRRVWQ